VYSEQVGKKRQEGGNKGDMNNRYNFMIKTNRYFIDQIRSLEPTIYGNGHRIS
jgi:hypothetical protein